MADTKRKLSDLAVIFQDNTSGQITPQNLRDGFESVIGSMFLSATSHNSSVSSDHIFIEAITSANDITILLPNLSGSDGNGDTFESKYYIFYNNGSFGLTLSATNGLIDDTTFYNVSANKAVGVISNKHKWLIYSKTAEAVNYDDIRTAVQENSGTWMDTSTIVASSSSNWDSAWGWVESESPVFVDMLTLLTNTSGNWNSSYSSLYNNSATWKDTSTTVQNTSSDWDSAWGWVQSESSIIDQTINVVTNTSANWNSVYNTIQSTSSVWLSSVSINSPLSGNGTSTSKLGVDVSLIDHNKLLNYNANEHNILNDSITSANGLWSSTKIQSELDTKSNVDHIHSLASLSDITIAIPTDGQILVYTSATNKWINSTNNSNANTTNGGVIQTVDLASCNSLLSLETSTEQYPYFSYLPLSLAAHSIDRMKFFVYSKDPGTINFVGAIYSYINNTISLLTCGSASVTETGFNTINFTSAIDMSPGVIYYATLLKKSTSASTLISDSCLPISAISFKGLSAISPYNLPNIENTYNAIDSSIWLLAYSSTSSASTSNITNITHTSASTIVSISGNYNANYNEFIKAYSTSGNIYINVPDPASYMGFDIRVKKMSSDDNDVILSAVNPWHIEGITSAGIRNQYTAITITSDGSSWLIN